MTTAHANVHQVWAESAPFSVARKQRKARKSSGFRAKSTYQHCIKDRVLIDQTCGSGGFFYKGYNFVELYNPSADVLLFVRASNAEIYAMRLSYVAL